MFTRCPHCATGFTVSAQQLRFAQGEVRCGNCAQVFNAVEWLTDEPAAEPTGATGPAIEPQSPAPDPAAETGTDETEATGETGTFPGEPDRGSNKDPEGSLEFDAPEPSWSSFFIEAAPAVPGKDILLESELESVTADPQEWEAMLAEIDPPPPWDASRAAEPADTNGDSAGAAPSILHHYDDGSDEDDSEETPREEEFEPEPGVDDIEDSPVLWIESTDEAVEDDADELSGKPLFVLGGARVTDTSADDWTGSSFDTEIAALAEDPEYDELPPAWAAAEADRPAGAWRRWFTGSVLLIVIAVLQLVHMNRDQIAADPRFGNSLRSVYARLGQTLIPVWPLDAYAVLRTEAIAGGTSSDALDISAALEVTADRPVGLPYVRISLRDQWASTVASRTFSPAEYLPEPMADIVPGGTRIPVMVSVLDPGVAARGYVVDICLPNRITGMRCQLAQDPFAQ